MSLLHRQNKSVTPVWSWLFFIFFPRAAAEIKCIKSAVTDVRQSSGEVRQEQQLPHDTYTEAASEGLAEKGVMGNLWVSPAWAWTHLIQTQSGVKFETEIIIKKGLKKPVHSPESHVPALIAGAHYKTFNISPVTSWSQTRCTHYQNTAVQDICDYRKWLPYYFPFAFCLWSNSTRLESVADCKCLDTGMLTSQCRSWLRGQKASPRLLRQDTRSDWCHISDVEDLHQPV